MPVKLIFLSWKIKFHGDIPRRLTLRVSVRLVYEGSNSLINDSPLSSRYWFLSVAQVWRITQDKNASEQLGGLATGAVVFNYEADLSR